MIEYQRHAVACRHLARPTNNNSPGGDMNTTQINVTDNGRIYANMSSLTYYSSVFIKAGTFSHFKFLGVNVDLVAQTISSGTIKSSGNGSGRAKTTMYCGM